MTTHWENGRALTELSAVQDSPDSGVEAMVNEEIDFFNLMNMLGFCEY